MTDDLRLSRLGQIAMPVQALDRATRFYRDVLGLRFLFDVPGQMAFFDCAGVRLMLTVPEGAEFEAPGSILYFSVRDIQRAHEVLAGKGTVFVRPPHCLADMGSHELWMAFFGDGEGNTLALMSEVAKEESEGEAR